MKKDDKCIFNVGESQAEALLFTLFEFLVSLTVVECEIDDQNYDSINVIKLPACSCKNILGRFSTFCEVEVRKNFHSL